MAWNENLQTASYATVEFEVVSISDSTSRRIVENEYLGRDGADLDDLGRGPQRGNCTAIFYGRSYEDALNAFIEAVDAGIPSEFVHPVLGSIQDCLIRIQSIEASESIGVDSAQVTFEYIQDGTNLPVETLESAQSIQVEIETELTAQTEVGAIERMYDTVRGYYESAINAANTVGSKFNEVSKFIDDTVKQYDDLTDPDSYRIVTALRRVQLACDKLKVRVEKTTSPMRQKEIYHSVPVSSVAASELGDGTRSSEIVERNKIRNPFIIQPGTVLQVPGK